MKVSEAIAQLVTFPLDAEIMDEHAENVLAGFRMSSYDDDTDGMHDYVIAEMTEFVEGG